MPDESILGGLGEVWDAGVDAAEHAEGAALHAGKGIADVGAAVSSHVLATGAELIGQPDLRDSLDSMSVGFSGDVAHQFSQAGDDLSAAGHDVVGDVEIDPSMLYNEAE
jgi:hypothetical protein